MTPSLHYLPTAQRDAESLAQRLGIPARPILLHRFPDGETRVTTAPATSTTLVYTSLDRPDEKLIALLLAADALRSTGAQRLVLVAPYLCYMRQDKAFNAGEAVSQRVIGRLLARDWARIVTVDPHLHRVHSLADVFPGCETDNISAAPAIAKALLSAPLPDDLILCGPDSESAQWVSDIAGRINRPFIIAKKRRDGDHAVQIQFDDREDLAGRPVVLVDDIVSSGGTLIACAEALRARGVRSIEAIITHALFPPSIMPDFAQAGIQSIRSSHSVPHPTNAISLDESLAEILRSELA